jgi:hypothetical protein
LGLEKQNVKVAKSRGFSDLIRLGIEAGLLAPDFKLHERELRKEDDEETHSDVIENYEYEYDGTDYEKEGTR